MSGNKTVVLRPEDVTLDALRIMSMENRTKAKYLVSLPTKKQRFEAILEALKEKDRTARKLAGAFS